MSTGCGCVCICMWLVGVFATAGGLRAQFEAICPLERKWSTISTPRSAGSSKAAVNLNYTNPSPPPVLPPLPLSPPLPQVTMDQFVCSLLCSKAYHWLRAESERARLRRGPPLCLSSWGGPSAPPCGPAPGGPRRPRVGPRWGVRGCGDGGGDGGLPDTTQVNCGSGQTGRQAAVHVSTGQQGCAHTHTRAHTHRHPFLLWGIHTDTDILIHKDSCWAVWGNKVFLPRD